MKKFYTLFLLLMALTGALAQAQKSGKQAALPGNKPQTRQFQYQNQAVNKMFSRQNLKSDQRVEMDRKQLENQQLTKIEQTRMLQSQQLLIKRDGLQKKIAELKLKDAASLKKSGHSNYSITIAQLEKQAQSNFKLSIELLNQARTYKSKVPAEKSGSNMLKGGAVIQKLDSIVSFDMYMGLKKESYTYDASGNAILAEMSVADSTNAWQPMEKIELAYNASGDITEYTSYHWDLALLQWIPSEKGQTDYDPVSGNPALETTFYWDTNSSSWIQSNKGEYTYDKYGNTTLSATYYWNTETSSWEGNSKYEFAYDAMSRDTMYASYSWDFETDQWYGSYKYVYAFDENGYSILNEYYNWDYGIQDWVGYSRTEYAYTATGDQTLYEYYYWDYGTMNWYPYSKQEFAYDGNGNRTLELSSSWNYDSLKLIYTWKYEYAFDEHDNMTLNASYYWSSGKWIGSSRYNKTFDSEDRVLTEEYFSWDSGSDLWVNANKYNYSYNAFGQQTLYESYNWNLTNGDWEGYTKTVAGFDGFGQDTLYIQYYWNISGEKWDTSYVTLPLDHYGDGKIKTLVKMDYYGAGSFDTTMYIALEYNALGRRTLETETTWDGESQWIVSRITEHAYDQHGNDTLKVVSAFDYYYYMFLPYTRMQLAYDANNELILDEHYYWNQEMGRWDGEQKYEYGYDANGNKILNASWNWNYDLGEWAGSSKEIMAYNDSGQTLLYELYYWDSGLGEWYGNYKYEYQLDEFGHTILDASYNWDGGIKNWVGTYKYEYAFSGPYQRTMESRYYWNTDLQIWNGDYKYTYIFDYEGSLVSNFYFYWDNDLNDWVNSGRNERFFDYSFDIDNLKQPYWVFDDYYNEGPGPEGKFSVPVKGSHEGPYYELQHRLLSTRSSSWNGEAWIDNSFSRFSYSGLGEETGNVSGFILTSEEQPVTSGIVYMFPAAAVAGGSVAVDTMRILQDGSFVFIGIPVGEYIIAAYPDTSVYKNALATYYGDVALWSSATLLNVTSGSNTTGITIHAVIPPVLDGNAILSGIVETIDLKSGKIIKNPGGAKGNPVKSAGVILVGRSKASTILARTVTDEFGNYSFKRVPQGTYDILVDIPGLTLVTYHTVTVEETDTEISDLNYLVGLTSISNDIRNSYAGKIRVYPNPVRNFVNIDIPLEVTGTSLVKIINMNGQVKQTEYCEPGTTRINLALPSGMYLMQINSSEGIAYRKLLLQ
ncbi:MAG: T9SS type A sorting domain-containing protein [Bacteroidales bacterium]